MPIRRNDPPVVVNTEVGQAELAALQTELFAAAREALAAARAEGKIPASLITSCHQIVKDSGLRPDVEGRGDDLSADQELAERGFDPNWVRNAINDLDVAGILGAPDPENV